MAVTAVVLWIVIEDKQAAIIVLLIAILGSMPKSGR